MRAGLVIPAVVIRERHYTVPVAPETDITVDITGLAPGGDAVGRQRGGAAQGRVTFVPLAAPGEVVRAKVVRGKARVVWAELTAVETPSPARVVPPCPLFGRCGGCQWQHVDPAVQRQQKGAMVSRALGLEVGPAQAVGPEFGYRERARMASGFDETGAPALGFRARRSHAIVDVPACPLLSPAAAAALGPLRSPPPTWAWNRDRTCCCRRDPARIPPARRARSWWRWWVGTRCGRWWRPMAG